MNYILPTLEQIKDVFFTTHAMGCKKKFNCKMLHRPIEVHIKYSPTCLPNPLPFVETLKASIIERFRVPEDVKVTSSRCPANEKAFEVWVVYGKHVFSRRNGDGLPDNDEKIQKIIDNIEEQLEKTCRYRYQSEHPFSVCSTIGGNKVMSDSSKTTVPHWT